MAGKSLLGIEAKLWVATGLGQTPSLHNVAYLIWLTKPLSVFLNSIESKELGRDSNNMCQNPDSFLITNISWELTETERIN